MIWLIPKVNEDKYGGKPIRLLRWTAAFLPVPNVNNGKCQWENNGKVWRLIIKRFFGFVYRGQLSTHTHTHTHTHIYIYIYRERERERCLNKWGRHFLSAYSVFDPFKSPYELFDFWIDWILKGTVRLPINFGLK